ncbi:MAG: hypothetical protein AMXMBFR23_00470 [Chloroflexota bacterium]
MTLNGPLLDESDEGSAPRPRRVDSLIASRRKPGEAPATDDGRPKVTRRSAARPEPEASPAAAGAEERKPSRRGRRGGIGRRKPGEGATPEVMDTADEPEAPAAPVVRRTRAARAAEPEAAPAPTPTPAPMPTLAAPVATTAALPSALAAEVANLRRAVDDQRLVLRELRAGMEVLAEHMGRTGGGTRARLGIFVDVPNLLYGYEGNGSLNMGKLLDMLRFGRELVRATAYSPVSDDPREPVEQQRFVAPFVPYEYRIVTKPLKRFADGSIKGNFDVEMAIDMLLMADRVDVMAIVSGDADFARAVEAVQQKGVRVEVVAFGGSTSVEMRALADHYMELNAVVDRILN